MNRRISFFNGAVFRTDVKRYWWVPVLHTLGITLLCLFPLYLELDLMLTNDFTISSRYQDAEFIHSLLMDVSVFPYLVLFIIPVALSMLLFSYLNKKSTVSTAHAQPVTRLGLYVTHTVFGLITLLLPILINAVILLWMRNDPMVSQIISLSHIWTWVYTQIAYASVAFGLSTMVGMLTGNIVAQPIFTYVFVALPFFIEGAVKYISNLHLYGYWNQSEFLVEHIYFGPEKIVLPASTLLYCGMALAFLIVGYMIYRLRNLENHGEVIAFPVLKPLFVYCVALCFGVLGFMYFSAIAQIETLFIMLPVGLLGLIIANMISKKAFTLRGGLKPALGLLLSVIALFCIFQLDYTGFESRMPEKDTIQSAHVTQRMYNNNYGTFYGRRVVEKEYIPNLTKPEDIENILKFHQYKIDEPTSDEHAYSYMFVHYTLKNGKEFVRRYPVNYMQDKAYLKPIMETTESKSERFPVLVQPEEQVISIKIEDDRLSGGIWKSYLLEKTEDKETIHRLYEALQKDVLAVPYDEFIERVATPTSIRIAHNLDLVYQGTDTPVPKESGYMTDTEEVYYIRQSFTHTKAVLAALGLYDILPTAQDYHSISVERILTQKGASQNVEASEYKNVEQITDPALISALYQHVTTVQQKEYMGNEDFLVHLTFHSTGYPDFSVTRSLEEAGMPEGLKAFFK